MEKKTETVCA